MSRTSDRLLHYLTDPDDSRPFGVAPTRHPLVSIPPTSSRTSRSSFSSAGSPPPSEASTHSFASRSSYQSDSSSSRKTSTSSISSAQSIPPWQLPDLNQHLAMNYDYVYGYDLPCECTFMDCQYRFNPEYHQEWINHGISHFPTNSLPRKLVCTFCPAEFDSGAHGDRMSNYTRRMNHIGSHFFENRTLQPSALSAGHPRPDYYLLDHFNRVGVLNNEDYNQLIQYTERPTCDGLQRRGFIPPEQLERQAREERQSREHHDLAKEERLRKREGKHRSGKGRATYPSERSRHYQTYIER